MSKRIVVRMKKRRSVARPTGYVSACDTCLTESQVTFGNRTQALQAARLEGIDTATVKLCTSSQGRVHLNI